MTSGKHISEDEIALDKLKDILLRQDRSELEELRAILNEPDKLSQRVTPLINSQLDFLKENFATEYETIIHELIDERLKQSQQEILDLIYPSLGKMISKYVALQISTLKDSIEDSVKSSFSFGRSIKSFFTGVKESDLIIQEAVVSTVEEVYIIQRDSGLLLASASNQNSMDKDVVAGMLTAIKSFVEDAFNKDSQDLEMIEYGSSKIIIRSYYSFYIALSVSGAVSATEINEFAEKIDSFAEEKMVKFSGNFENSSVEISDILEQTFIEK